MSTILKRSSILLFLLILVFSTASATVFIGQDKPDDWQERNLLRITVAEFPYNDAFLLECNDETMIIDGGVKKYRKRFMDYLRSRDLTHVNYIFNSHPHDDHLQGTYLNIKLEGLTADEFISLFPETYRNDIQAKAIVVLESAGIPYRQISPGSTLSLGDAEMTVYQWVEGNDANAKSALCRLKFGNSTMIFGADIPGEGQRWIARQFGSEVLKADILKVPHHAIVTMVPEFLQAVDPDLAIITSKVSATKKTNQQLERAGIPYLHHSLGTIILETDGIDWYIEQIKGLI